MNPSDIYSTIREYCLAKEGCTEEHPWGDTAWKVKGKAFAFGCDGSAGFTVKSTLEKQAALTMHPQIEVAKYVGRYGWVTIEVVDNDTLDLAKDLIDESYNSVARSKSKR